MTDVPSPTASRRTRRSAALLTGLALVGGAALAGWSPTPAGAAPAAAPVAADLSVTVSHTPSAPVTGKAASFTITVANAGPGPAADVAVGITTGYQLRYAPAPQPSGPACGVVSEPGSVICDLGDLPAGATRAVQVPVIAAYAGIVTVPVAVASETPDPDLADRSTTDTVLVRQGPTQVELALADTYRAVLGREATAREVAYWGNVWTSGRYPDPWRVPYALISGSESRTRRVRDAYRRILGRTPGASELSTWSAALARGLTVEGLDVRLATSSEAQRGRPDFDRQLELLYSVVLGRRPTSAETSTWRARHDAGLSLGAVGTALTRSTEARDRVLRARFRSAGLHPTNLDRFFWFTALNEGSTSDREWAKLLVSAGYLQRFALPIPGYPVF